MTHEENRGLPDLSVREWIVLIPIVAGCFWIGLYPNAVLSRIEPSAKALAERVSVESGLVEMIDDEPVLRVVHAGASAEGMETSPEEAEGAH